MQDKKANMKISVFDRYGVKTDSFSFFFFFRGPLACDEDAFSHTHVSFCIAGWMSHQIYANIFVLRNRRKYLIRKWLCIQTYVRVRDRAVVPTAFECIYLSGTFVVFNHKFINSCLNWLKLLFICRRKWQISFICWIYDPITPPALREYLLPLTFLFVFKMIRAIEHAEFNKRMNMWN